MKIVVNKNELNALKSLINTIETIEGVPMSKFRDSFKITTRAYIMSLVTGELTIDINEDCLCELINISNDMVSAIGPILKAAYSLGQAMAPAIVKYQNQYDQWYSKYTEEPVYRIPGWNYPRESVVEFEREVV